MVSGSIACLSLLLVSCVTNKKLTYLQYEGKPTDTIISVTPAEYKVLPYDNLFIKVVTPDPNISEMFNMIPVTSQGISTSEQSADIISYTVDKEGNISLPYAGKVSAAGKTLSSVSLDVESILRNYIADPSVTVKMINNYVSILGEVQRPGKYPIYKERLNIFQALAMGGDLGIFSDRQKIKILRPTAKGNLVKEFSLTDQSILTSEFFYVLPNDVIYAQPLKGKFFKMDAFPYTIILSSLTTVVLFWNIFK